MKLSKLGMNLSKLGIKYGTHVIMPDTMLICFDDECIACNSESSCSKVSYNMWLSHETMVFVAWLAMFLYHCFQYSKCKSTISMILSTHKRHPTDRPLRTRYWMPFVSILEKIGHVIKCYDWATVYHAYCWCVFLLADSRWLVGGWPGLLALPHCLGSAILH